MSIEGLVILVLMMRDYGTLGATSYTSGQPYLVGTSDYEYVLVAALPYYREGARTVAVGWSTNAKFRERSRNGSAKHHVLYTLIPIEQ